MSSVEYVIITERQQHFETRIPCAWFNILANIRSPARTHEKIIARRAVCMCCDVLSSDVKMPHHLLLVWN